MKAASARGGAPPTPGGPAPNADEADIVRLAPILRRVVAARVHDPHSIDDVVQETLVRVMSARRRLDPAALVPYAIVTARAGGQCTAYSSAR